MKIKLSDHFTYARLFRFVIPSIIMMIFTSVYGVVDGFFVSNYVGKTEFAAINLIMPFPMLLGAFGIMIGSGGSALVSMTLGQGKQKEANEIFSMLIRITVIVGMVLAVLGIVFTKEVAHLFGATEELLNPCITYGRILLLSLMPYMLQNAFQSFLITAEKPSLGLGVTVVAGLTNVVLDFVLIGILRGGVVGAAIATAVSQLVGGMIPLAFFLRKNTSQLQIISAKVHYGHLFKTCTNGASELMTNVSIPLVNILYNLQLLKYAGENGVAAYGVIMYVTYIFITVFIGYAIGTAPIAGYNYGAGNHTELKNIFQKSIVFNIVSGAVMCIVSILMADFLSGLFVSYDAELMAITKRGFIIYSISFIVTGINVYASSFFTALGNGFVSALISFLRFFVFQLISILLLPGIFGLDGIWFSIVMAEVLALFVCIYFFVTNKKKYSY